MAYKYLVIPILSVDKTGISYLSMSLGFRLYHRRYKVRKSL